MKSILIASRDSEVEKVIRSGIDSKYIIFSVSNLNSALERLRKKRYDFIFMDMELLPSSDSGDEYEKIFQLFWDLFPTVEIVILSSKKMIRGAVAAVKAGASHYLTYPLDPEEVKYTMENLDQSKIFHSELDYLRKYSREPEDFEFIRTQSPLMEKVFEKMRLVAPTKSTVLLSGETGTGKNVMAHLIHKRSNRRNASFISVHCGAITESLLESELFGHEKGAFTGMERAYIIESTPVLTPESFPQELFPSSFSSSEKEFLDSSFPTLKEMREKSREDAERTYLEKLLRHHKGRIKDSAASAGISPRQLNKLMKKHNLRKEKFKA